MGDLELAMSPSQLRYPILRRNLESAVDCFADQAFQARVWSNPTISTPEGRWDFIEAFEFVVDDLGSADLSGLVGEVLVDQEELILFSELHSALLAVAALERSGQRLRYDEVSETREWSAVREAAVRLRSALASDDVSR